MNGTTEAPVASEPQQNSTAAFLFDEVNPVFEEAVSSSAEETTPGSDGTEILAQQAAAAQTEVDPPVVITPEQEKQIAAQPEPPAPQAQQLPPIIEPVIQQPVAQPVQQPAQAVAPPSEQEIRQQLNIYSLTEADYDSVFDTEDKQASIRALDAILQKAVRQAVTMSHVLVQEAQQKITQTVQPYMQFADEQKQSALESAFYGRHQELTQARPVVDAVLKQFQASGQKFATPEQLFDAVAQNTKAYLQQLQQLGQTAAPVTQGQNTVHQASKPRMAVLPSGGQGGAGASGGNSGKVNTAQKLFG